MGFPEEHDSVFFGDAVEARAEDLFCFFYSCGCFDFVLVVGEVEHEYLFHGVFDAFVFEFHLSLFANIMALPFSNRLSKFISDLD